MYNTYDVIFVFYSYYFGDVFFELNLNFEHNNHTAV